ncbi:hypothetical protein J1605_017135 [Eschrichtius robustus]|uniref:Uncharacterized protein n=1 Tax=Eschrichtius robustus TaxID=9764 RepID=A0AB34I2L7_ESCRO|nr:hypothetical protein J1605_017135 [Eschrichtius robustus]
MGNGMCSRKQKRIFQTLLLLTVVFGFLYGAMLYYELQTQLRKAEAVALKYQQHQESLSAQLQEMLDVLEKSTLLFTILQLSTVSSMFTVSLSASRALKDGGRLHRVGSQGNKSDSQCGELGFTTLSISLQHIVLDPKLAAWAVPSLQMILSQTPPQPGV